MAFGEFLSISVYFGGIFFNEIQVVDSVLQMELQAKQKEGGLSEKEHQELMGLVDQVEALEAKRLESMIALAHLWNISLEVLRERLGIKAPEPHVW